MPLFTKGAAGGTSSALDHYAHRISYINRALSGLPNLESVAMTDGQICLLIAQTDKTENGPWFVSPLGWTRVLAVGTTLNPGARFRILNGQFSANSVWHMSDATPRTIGQTMDFDMVSGPGWASHTASAISFDPGTTVNVYTGAQPSSSPQIIFAHGTRVEVDFSFFANRASNVGNTMFGAPSFGAYSSHAGYALAATDANAVYCSSVSNISGTQVRRRHVYTGVTKGVSVLNLKYRSDGGTGWQVYLQSLWARGGV